MNLKKLWSTIEQSLPSKKEDNMHISKEGIALIKKFEGCRLTAYQDSVGVWTIGYGHTKDVDEGLEITKQEAEVMVKEELIAYDGYITDRVEVAIERCRLDAVVW